ncbi:MAG: hypothetical protein N2450_05410 [bacterium]|nr:hypothetical protein [bacterium]
MENTNSTPKQNAGKKSLQRSKRRNLEQVGRSRTAFFTVRMFTLMFLLAVIGYWGYTQVMSQMYGRFDLFQHETERTAGVPEGWYGDPRVILINPARTEIFLRNQLDTARWPYGPRNDDWPLADTLWYAKGIKRVAKKDVEAWRLTGDRSREGMLVDYWKDYLTKKNIYYKVYEEPALLGDLTTFDLMILPGAVLLSDAEKSAIKKFVANGGNILTCWSIGARNENAEWIGFDFLSQLIGAIPTFDVRDTTGGTSVVLNGNSPINAMIPPGTHLEFFTYNAFITMEVVEPRSHVGGWWFYPYWKENANPNQRAMIVHGEYLKGKFVWFSFTPETIQDAKNNHIIFDRMVNNAIHWLHGKPLVNVNLWPIGYRSAAALILNVTGNTYEYEKLSNSIDFGSTQMDLLVDTDFPISNKMKIPTQSDWIIKANPKIKLSDNDIIEQNKWMKYQVERVEKAIGKSPVGYMPPNWNSDGNTYIVCARNNLKFLLSDQNPRHYGPESRLIKHSGWWVFQRKSHLLTMPKASVSLDEWLNVKSLESSKNAVLWMKADLQRIANAGGLYVGIFDASTSIDEEKEFLQDISNSIDSLGMWRAPISKIMERYGAWINIKASAEPVSKTRIRVNISNTGNFTIRDIPVTVYLIREFESVTAKPEQVSGQIRRTVWNRSQGMFTFTIEKIGAKDNVTIYIDVAAKGVGRIAAAN